MRSEAFVRLIARWAVVAVLVVSGPVRAQDTPAATPADARAAVTPPLEAVPTIADIIEAGGAIEANETVDTDGAGAGVNAQARGPAPTPVPSGPKRVVVVGDNLAFGVARDVEEALGDIPELTVERLAVGSSGLVRDDFHDWPAELTEILKTPTTAVVLLIGANDRQQLRDEKGRHDPNSEDWLRLYETRVEALAAIPKAAGVPLVWVEMPIMSSGSLTSTLKLTNALFRAETEAVGGVFVETWDQFADETGRYSRSGPDLTGTPKRLRTGDGIHFTKAGYDVLAHLIAKPLLQLPALAGDPEADQAEVEAMMLGSVDMPPAVVEPAALAPDTVSLGETPESAGRETPPEVAAIPGDALDGSPEAQPEIAPTTLPVGSGEARSPAAASPPTVREVRVGRPFLLTQPGAAESELIAAPPRPDTVQRLTNGTAPQSRADNAGLPTY